MPRLLIDGHHIDMEPGEHAVFAELYNARGEWVSNEHLIGARYPGHSAPMTADKVIAVYLSHLREKLQPTDFRIFSRGSRGWREGLGSRIDRLPPVVQV